MVAPKRPYHWALRRSTDVISPVFRPADASLANPKLVSAAAGSKLMRVGAAGSKLMRVGAAGSKLMPAR